VLDWLSANPVDVLALQETKLTDDKFPHDAFAQAGYQSQWFGQKTYNGVALLTKTEAVDVVKNIPGFEDELARVISGTVQGVRVIGAYFPNGQAPGSDLRVGSQVIHACSDHRYRARHQFRRPRTGSAMAAHIIHFTVKPRRQPRRQACLRLGQINARKADGIKAQAQAERANACLERLRVGRVR
jgi:hypothetical protein